MKKLFVGALLCTLMFVSVASATLPVVDHSSLKTEPDDEWANLSSTREVNMEIMVRKGNKGIYPLFDPQLQDGPRSITGLRSAIVSSCSADGFVLISLTITEGYFNSKTKLAYPSLDAVPSGVSVMKLPIQAVVVYTPVNHAVGHISHLPQGGRVLPARPPQADPNDHSMMPHAEKP